jgi:hypothetical protein
VAIFLFKEKISAVDWKTSLSLSKERVKRMLIKCVRVELNFNSNLFNTASSLLRVMQEIDCS